MATKDFDSSPNEVPSKVGKSAAYWNGRLTASARRLDPWMRKAEVYETWYLNQTSRSNLTTAINESKEDRGLLRHNIFYANTELLHSALLTEIPQPALERRYAKEQAQDPAKKKFYATVSELMEEVLSYNVKNPELEREFSAFKYDYLITGRGVLWVSYEAEVSEDGQAMTNEAVKIEHIQYRDFRMSSGSKWSDIFWVARRHKLSREALVERWGEIGKQIELNYIDDPKNIQFDTEDIKRAEVWEIWDKSSKKVYFVCPSYRQAVLQVMDDPYHLKGFFPTPEPLRSVHSNFTMIPTPELDLYLREARALSTCAARIARLVDSTRAKAFFAAQNKDIVSKLNAARDDEYIAIDNMDAIMSNGGMPNFFAHAPIDVKDQVVAGLSNHADRLIQTIYEITGISDIQRNISPEETATATVAKGRFGSLRLRSRQKSINDYIRSVYSIAAEIICELFSIETFKEISSMEKPHENEKMMFQQSQQAQQAQYVQQVQLAQMQGMQPPPPPQVDKQQEKFFAETSWEEIKQFLENDKLRSYMMDMETTFNLWEDEQEEIKSRLDYLGVLNEGVQQAIAVSQSNPKYLQLILKNISWTLDGFSRARRVKNETDDIITEILEEAQQMMENPPPKQPTPEEMAGQSELMSAQADQMNAATKAREAEIKAQKLEIDAAKVAGELEIDKNKLVLDASKAAAEQQRTVEESFNKINTMD